MASVDQPTTAGQMMVDILVFFINGQREEICNPNPKETLLQFLREKLHLTGAKEACGEGGCGSCTVMLSKFDRAAQKISHYAVNACITPLCSLHGLAVTTIEGIGGSARTRLHPVQESLVQHHGTQCGFCTPGFVMSMYTVLRDNPTPTEQEVHECIRGNLCRCTGYRPIIEGFKIFSRNSACPLGEQCCQKAPVQPELSATQSPCFMPFDESQEPIFPSELVLTDSYDKQNLEFKQQETLWLRPTTLDGLRHAVQRFSNHVIVSGSTYLPLDKGAPRQGVFINTGAVPEMLAYEFGEADFRVGSAVTLSKLQTIFRNKLCAGQTDIPETRGIKALLTVIDEFAATQIRNMGTLGGNVAAGLEHSDLIPMLISLGCTMELMQERGRTSKPVGHTIGQGDVILSFTIPHTRNNQYAYFQKHTLRADLDATILSMAMKITLKPNSTVVEEIVTCLGGVCKAANPLISVREIVGKTLNREQIQNVIPLLEREVETLIQSDELSTVKYKTAVASGMFLKSSLLALADVAMDHAEDQGGSCPVRWKSVTESLHKWRAESSRKSGEDLSAGNFDARQVGKPLTHVNATQQVTGEAHYVDDVLPCEREIHVALVTSSRPHAKILRVDPSESLAMEGVIDYLSHEDVPGSNKLSLSIEDEEVFASTVVTCVGQVIGAILATTKHQAEEAVKFVKVDYEDLPFILDLREAIQKRSFLCQEFLYQTGDIAEGFANSDHIIEDELALRGQEHFYMEPQGTVCTPVDGGIGMEVTSSAQCPDFVQMKVASTLNVPANHVSCNTVSVGGAFGGKDSRAWIPAVVAAVGAYKHKRPTRCTLTRSTDMQVTGGRHPALAKYKVGANKGGKVLALELEIFLNGGHTLDYSGGIAELCAYKFDNCYSIPAAMVRVTPCKTNLPSNTSCRAAGTMQAILACEHWMSHLAEVVGITQSRIREVNFYQEGDPMAFNMTAENSILQKCWNDLKSDCQYEKLMRKVVKFNSENQFKKRGLAMTPVRFSFPFVFSFLNQSGALVNMYKDGTVILHHGGVELGQGLHTKMIQIASEVMEMPAGDIFTGHVSTDVVPNSSPTAGSSSSDVHGMAVFNACCLLKERLKPYREANVDGTMRDWAQAAYFDRVSLSAAGFYEHPRKVLYDWKTGEGQPHDYHSYSAACSEVEIDVLTGDHAVLRTDIMLDAGQSLNPAIDIGQIEGGFIMGYGFCVSEELRYDAVGKLLTTGPNTYKIPSVSSIPRDFNVNILKGSKNPKAIYSSKGVGEPGVILACSVYLAIHEAIRSARRQIGLPGYTNLGTPLTAHRIRMACGQQLSWKALDN